MHSQKTVKLIALAINLFAASAFHNGHHKLIPTLIKNRGEKSSRCQLAMRKAQGERAIHPQRKMKMKPIDDVLSFLEWSPSIPKENFKIGFKDRYEGIKECEIDFDDEYSLVKTMPTHRIYYVKYRGTKIWDRRAKLDLVFGSTVDENIDFRAVMEACAVREMKKKREGAVARRIKELLGDQFPLFQEMSSAYRDGESTAEEYYKASVELIGNAGLYIELVSFLPDSEKREALLNHHLRIYNQASGMYEDFSFL